MPTLYILVYIIRRNRSNERNWSFATANAEERKICNLRRFMSHFIHTLQVKQLQSVDKLRI